VTSSIRVLAGWGERTAISVNSVLRATAPAMLFGLRLWAAACLALYAAFWLELDNAYWAAATAVIVCQPSLGASLRKGWFRLIGTVIGALAIVVLAGCFPQQRIAFLTGLAIWGAACCFVASLLRNFAAYAASLAGYTAAIIAIDLLGSTGGANGGVLLLAISRASEICIGIISAGVVLAATDLGAARRRLMVEVTALSSEITDMLVGTLSADRLELLTAPAVWRELAQRIGALDAAIDVAIGESPDLRLHMSELQSIAASLFAALAAWRGVGVHLERLPEEQRRHQAARILSLLPRNELASLQNSAANVAAFRGVRADCSKVVRRLIALKDPEPSLRLLADQTAAAFIRIRHTIGGLLVLIDPARHTRAQPAVRLPVPDLLPSLVNAARAFVTIAAVASFWIVTAWPNGAQAIAFAAIAVILFSTQSDQAYAAALGFVVGVALTTICAAVVDFLVLPRFTSFAGLSFAMALMLVPAGALMTMQVRLIAVFAAVTTNFVPLLAPANQMNYDLQQFRNAALGILAGAGAGAAAFRLIPPLSPTLRARRLLSLMLHDLRSIAADPATLNRQEWASLAYSRLSALPEQAEPRQRGQLLSALAIGCGIDELWRAARRFGLTRELRAGLLSVADGHSMTAVAQLSRFDDSIAAVSDSKPGARVRLRARGQIIAVSEALSRHQAYFDQEARLELY